MSLSLQLGLGLGTRLVRGSFSPASLFAAGEQGAWYDPSDLTSMRQLSTGATAAAVGSPVGFMADKRLMGGRSFDGFVASQPELVTNGTFDSNVTGWTGNLATLSWDAGLLRMTTTGSNGSAYQAFSTVIGTAYLVNGDCLTNAVNKQINKSDTTSMFGANFVEFSFSTAGTVPLGGRVFVATATTTYIHLGFSGSGAGNVLDFDNISVKELPGNHATQSNAAQRPTYGVVPATGRRNLLTFTEQFDNAAWTKVLSASVSANSETSPIGDLTADTFVAGAANSALRQTVTLEAIPYTFSVWLKRKTGTGNVEISTTGGSWAVRAVTTDWTRFSITQTPTAGSNFPGIRMATLGDEVYVWGAQLETGSTATAYQRVVTAFDVTEAGVASMSYLSFDGTDDSMLTGNIVPGTDKAQMFAGVRKLSDGNNIIVETSANSGSSTGSFGVLSSNYGAAGAAYAVNLNGSQRTSFDATTFTAPTTDVLSSMLDIAGANRADEIAFRVNGVTPVLVGGGNANAGTGNFTTQPLYIGRRGGALQVYNGQIFGLIVRFGANLSADQITQTETWLANRVAPTVVIP